ncbi:Gfo/Idh/MocA family oxidoreductase [Ornithinibacillus sp. 179-J 7C1 HS]
MLMQRVGLVGLGFIGKSHLEAYNHIPNVEVTAIYTKSRNDEEALSSYNFVSDYEGLLSDDQIDVVDICIPTYLHEEFILKAAKAKKHIICEKPLTLSRASAHRIYEEVQKAGVRLFVGQVLRFWPEYSAIKAYSETKKLGSIDIVHAQRLGQLPSWSEWFQQPDKSGGALFDLHLHDIDFVYYLLGKVDEVYAVGTQNQYGAWSHIMTTLSFQNGAKAFVEASHRMTKGYPFTMGFRMQNQEDTLDFQLKAGENIESINNSHFLLYEKKQITEVEIKQTDAFQEELSYFIDCIDHNQKNTVVPISDILYVLEILEAIEKSLNTGQVVKI